MHSVQLNLYLFKVEWTIWLLLLLFLFFNALSSSICRSLFDFNFLFVLTVFNCVAQFDLMLAIPFGSILILHGYLAEFRFRSYSFSFCFVFFLFLVNAFVFATIRKSISSIQSLYLLSVKVFRLLTNVKCNASEKCILYVRCYPFLNCGLQHKGENGTKVTNWKFDCT